MLKQTSRVTRISVELDELLKNMSKEMNRTKVEASKKVARKVKRK